MCNECVMNVSSFYNFKKKINHAQEYLNSCTAVTECTQDDENIEETCEEDETDDGGGGDGGGGGGGGGVGVDATEQVDENDERGMIVYTLSEEDGISEEYLDSHHSPTNEMEHIYLIPMESGSKYVNSSNGNASCYVNVIAPEKRKMVAGQFGGQTKRSKAAAIDNSEKVTTQMNECLVCPAILSDIIDLNTHILTHKSIVCKTCKRLFARYSNLKRHFNSAHSKPKPFQCDICGLGFSFSINLQAHAEIHYTKNIRMT